MTIHKIILSCLFVVVFLSCSDNTPQVPDKPANGNDTTTIDDDFNWVKKISLDHPRLFINKNNFPEIKNIATTSEKSIYDGVKLRVDGLFSRELSFVYPLVADGSGADDHLFGTRAAEAAFVFLVEGNANYLELAISLLKKAIEYYELRNSNQLNIHWYSYSRIHALMAYDWLYNYLSEEERIEMGTSLFDAIEYMLPSERPNFYRENRSGITAGFYNNQSLEWYLGLVFFKTGIRSIKSEEYLKKGYDSHVQMIEYREAASGDDGGASSGTLAYSFLDYPWAEYNFFSTFISATGIDISVNYDYLANFSNYLYWSLLPKNREFGYGDSQHNTNLIDFPILNLHLTQLLHFYGDRFPEHASLTKWLMEEKYPRKSNEQSSFPLARFFITRRHTSIPAVNPVEKLPVARYFENMGQFFMRSGSGNDDVYATFTVGSTITHKHYDNNNFVIYKNGYGCLDTGTRPSPGIHLSHYYARTVAHNCVTITMPNEKFPGYWGSPAPNETNMAVPNDGGQNNLSGTNVVAFDENEHYVYIASDATSSYNAKKTNLVLRQFVFLPPNNFLIFDRVNSTNRNYKKKWLIHTADKPVIEYSTNEFHAIHEGCKLVSKTIFPVNMSIELIGGEGKQFWSDGRNWSLPYGGDNNPLYGQWRVEVSPATSNNDDIFLHVIQASDSKNNTPPIEYSKIIDTADQKGVSFVYEGKEFEIVFSTTGAAAGKISIKSNGTVLLHENFSNSIKEQKGLAFK